MFLTQQTCLFKHTKIRWGKYAKKVILIVQCLSEEPGHTPHDGLNREASLTFSTLSMFSTSTQGINFVLNGKISCLISRRNLPLVLQVKVFNLKKIIPNRIVLQVKVSQVKVFNLKKIILIKNRGKKILKALTLYGQTIIKTN